MIQRMIGGGLGALVTWLILVWNNVNSTVAVTAAVVGAIAAFLWPIIVGFVPGPPREAAPRRLNPGRGGASGRRSEQRPVAVRNGRYSSS